MGAILSLIHKEYLAISADILVTLRVRCYWHLVGRDEGYYLTSYSTYDLQFDPNIDIVEIEIPCPRNMFGATDVTRAYHYSVLLPCSSLQVVETGLGTALYWVLFTGHIIQEACYWQQDSWFSGIMLGCDDH